MQDDYKGDGRFPTDWESWPEGGEHFARMARKFNPSLTFDQLRTVAAGLYGTPVMAPGWGPCRGQSAQSILKDEGVALAMALQAWADRVEWALGQCSDPHTLSQFAAALSVMASSLRYLTQCGGDA